MRRRLVLFCTIVALFAIPWAASAQRTTGDIRGVITDGTGAVLPGVTVTLRGPAVPGAPTAVTNETGLYRFPNLPPGTYTVRAELQGFSISEQTGVVVLGSADQTLGSTAGRVVRAARAPVLIVRSAPGERQ